MRLLVKSSVVVMLVALFVQACSWTASKKPNVVIIAVDSLPSSEFSCSEDMSSQAGAFGTLCQESVRFTHAFTTSILNQAAMASILTGKYPLEHGLRHNGSTALPAQEVTLPELAITAGYRTALFSGGATIFRKSGLDQGFEVFEDNISPRRELLYRPVSDNIDFFRNWVGEDPARPFFTVFYVPDLIFTMNETIDNVGEARNRSYNSQLLELDESLEELIQFLKRSGRWDNTIFIIAGLRGQTHSLHRDELPSTNLYSDNTQVALLAKPTRKARDLGLKWKIDRNVSLVDLGPTLAEAIGVELIGSSPDQLEKVSLLKALRGEDPDWSSERLLLIESAWASWHGLGPIRWAARKGHWLYLHNDRPLVYNTLIDRMELVPSSLNDQTTQELALEMLSFFRRYQVLQWVPLPTELADKFYIATQRWLPSFTDADIMKSIKLLYQQGYEDPQILSWWAGLALENQNWEDLKRAAQLAGNTNWMELAESHLSHDEVEFTDPCLSTLDHAIDESETLRRCDDRLFLVLRDWIMHAAGSEEKEQARESFLRRYRLALIEKRVHQLNYAFGGIWDVNLKNPDGPDRIDITLGLPEYRRYRRVTRLRLGL